MKNIIKFENIEYKILENFNDAIDDELLKQKVTDYFFSFDYIVGDWAYGKLRLKGFNKKNNKNYKSLNDFNNVKDYIHDYCAYGCKYFILEKIEVEK